MSIKSFKCYPVRQTFPKSYTSTIMGDSESNEITFRIYACETSDKDVKINGYGNVSLLGNLPELSLGVEYEVKAKEENKNGNYQYKVISIKRDVPMDSSGVRLFLNEILTHSQVEEIMREYPNIITLVNEGKVDTIDLKKLHGIGEYIIKVIEKKILENFKFAEIIAEFNGLINYEILKKLYVKFPTVEQIKQEIKKNPYKCLTDISRIGFKTADNIILKFEKECISKDKSGEVPPIKFDYDVKTSKQRLVACLDYLLSENENQGHTKMILEDVAKNLNIMVKDAYHHLVGVLKSDEFVIKKPYVARREIYDTEVYISNSITTALRDNRKWSVDLSKYEDKGLTDEQLSAVKMVADNKVSVLNGSAGSGKTFTTKTIISMLEDNKISYCLACPTGKASKVLSKYTDRYAQTVHRLLGAKGADIFEMGEDNKLNTEIVIVDEFGMMDIFLTKNLLSAIDFNRTKLLLIGDSNQLPSVSCGNVFHDLLESNIVPKTALTKVFRYGVGGIMTVATNTRLMKETITDAYEKQHVLGEDKGYVYFNVNQEYMIKNLMSLYKKLLKTNNPEDIAVLTSYNKGDYGTVVINNALQELANPFVQLDDGKFIKVYDTKFYENDLVMQTVNNYKARIYKERKVGFYEEEEESLTFISNGETGVITDIVNGCAIIKFGDELVIYNANELMNCRLSYACGIYKFQGDASKIVILLTPKAHTYMLNSNLIYVGLTRATDRVYHFGELKTFNRAIKIKENYDRQTFLGDLLLKSFTKPLDTQPTIV